MTAHIGLYFPYFHFPNDEWLKVSSLYWDKVYRIVPKNYRTDRDTEIVNPNAPPTVDRRLAHIFHKKFDYELVGMLIKTGLAMHDDSTGHIDWIGMHPKLANVYMAALADMLANRTQTNPLTNEAINYFAVGGFTFERLAQVLL